MAPFNPAIPDTNDPNWLGWSKPISQPQADTSTGEVLSTVGTSLQGGLSAADTLLKQQTKDLARAGAEKIMDEYTSTLEKTDISTRIAAAAAGGQGVPTSDTSTDLSAKSKPGAGTLSASPTEEVPEELQNLPANLDNMVTARGNNKLSSTAYAGRLAAMAKDLRARYPGYVDYIDDEVKKVTGMNPANHYITSLLGDINSFADAGKAIDTKIRSELWSHLGDSPYIAQILSAYNAGRYGNPREAEPRIMAAISPYIIAKKRLELRAAQRADAKGTREELEVGVENDANKAMESQATLAFNTLHLMQGSPTAAQISDIIAKANAGEITLTGDQAQTLSRAVRTLKFQAEQGADATFFNKQGPDGRLNRSVLGETKVTAIKKGQFEKFDIVADLLENKQYGLAFKAMNSIRAIGDEDTHTMITVPELAQKLRLLKALDNYKLPAASRQLLEQSIAEDLIPKMKEYTDYAQKKMILQPDTPSGVVNTIKGQLETMERRAKAEGGPKISKEQVAKSTESLLATIDKIPTIQDPRIQSNIAKAAFDPSNLGLLTKFEEDHYKGERFIPGKYSIFNRLYAPDMTKTMKALGGQDWENYKDIAKQMWGRELFGPFLQRFSNASMDNLLNNNFVKVGWDPDNFKMQYDFTGPVSPSTKNYLKQNFDRLNASFDKLINIAKEEGRDPNALILGWLKEHGVDTGRLPGLPEKLMQEIINSKTAEKTEAEGFAKRFGAKPQEEKTPSPRVVIPEGRINPLTGLPFPARKSTKETPPVQPLQLTDEGVNAQRGSLSDFLSAPAGVVATQRKNAPAASRTRTRGNLSDGEIIGVGVTGDSEDAFSKVNPNYGR